MDPTVDSVQVDWLWRIANGLAFSVLALIAYAWKRLDGRVSQLESASAGHDDIAELKTDIKRLHEKLDRMQEKLIEVLLARQV